MSSVQVPEGYKQSEVGVIPEEWSVVSIGEIANIFVGKDVNERRFSSVKDNKYKYPVYSNTVENEGLYGYYDYAEFSGNSLTVVGRGVGLGTAFSRIDSFGAIGRLVVIFPNKECNNEFLTNYINHKVDIFSESSGVPQLTGIGLAKYKVALPSQTEQSTIAQALSDVDALIASLDKLIAKQRHLKTAAMQQLLTGKMRLPGFSGGWQTKLFSEIASCRKDRLDPRKSNIQNFCVELEHIESGTGRLLGNTQTEEQSSLKAIFQPNDVLFGKLRSYLRKYWLADRKGVCSTEIWVLVANSQLATPEFLYQVVRVDQFIEAASTAYGTHMPRADWNVVKNYEVAVPTVEEQRAIATVLSDMDSAIAALETRRAKTQAIKQGMMQELLTGRTRLV